MNLWYICHYGNSEVCIVRLYLDFMGCLRQMKNVASNDQRKQNSDLLLYEMY